MSTDNAKPVNPAPPVPGLSAPNNAPTPSANPYLPAGATLTPNTVIKSWGPLNDPSRAPGHQPLEK